MRETEPMGHPGVIMNSGLGLAAVVLAGGQGRRMGTAVPKQFLEVGGRPLIYYSLKAFEESGAERIVLVAPAGSEEYCRKEIVERYGFRKVAAIVEGGAERFDSVYAGLRALWRARNRAEAAFQSAQSTCSVEDLEKTFCGPETLVAIHDGARAMVTPELIRRCYADAALYGACVAAVPARDTIRRAGRDGFGLETLPREELWIIQTPQTFRADLIFRAYASMMEMPGGTEGVTDDAMAVERFTDCRVRLTTGDPRNLKVTTPEDLVIAEGLLKP